MASDGFSIGVERKKLIGHVADRFAHARFARLPNGRPQTVKRRLRAAQRLIFLYEIEPRERHVKLCVARKSAGA